MKFRVDGEDYIVQRKAGDGAAGAVRKVQRARDDAEFAAKFLAPDPKYIDEAVFEDVATRFRREGERGTQMAHPNLLQIHKYVENDGGRAFVKSDGPRNPFLIMEYLPGKTLENYIKRSDPGGEDGFVQLSLTKKRLNIALQIADALQYVHDSKMVHRDVKPANIFFGDEFFSEHDAKLGDFGIMKWGDFNASLTTGNLTATNQSGLGTLKYMAPEQAIRPRDVSNRADIFSLGITLYELFTGRILAGPHNVFEVMMHRLQRGTTAGRFENMGVKLDFSDIELGELLLDMFLRGSTGRPNIRNVYTVLSRAYESKFSDDE